MTCQFRSALCCGLVAATLFSGTAHAQAFLDDPVDAEVLQGWDLPDGRRVSAIRLTLAPGWKTYWRAPGDTGIPPHFDWSRARNIDAVDISWPTPSIYVEHGMRALGYKNQLVIPMYLTPANPTRPMRLRTTLSMGVCAEVCLPYELKLDTVLDAPAPKPTPAIVAALADAPYSAKEAGVRAATCKVTPSEYGMKIEARVTLPYTGGTEVSAIEPGLPGVWVSEPTTTRTGDTIIAISEMVHQNGGPFSVNRADVRITILGGDYAVDVQGCTAG